MANAMANSHNLFPLLESVHRFKKGEQYVRVAPRTFPHGCVIDAKMDVVLIALQHRCRLHGYTSSYTSKHAIVAGGPSVEWGDQIA